MLVLKREVDERIMIGDSIIVSVVEIHNGRVKIGIEAPQWVRIAREEVYEPPTEEVIPEDEMPRW